MLRSGKFSKKQKVPDEAQDWLEMWDMSEVWQPYIRAAFLAEFYVRAALS